MEEEQKAVARRSRKWIFLLVGVATFSACHQTLPPSPQTVYEAARLKFQHGELIEAQADAEHAYDRYAQQSPEWASRFRVLRAEILLWRGMSNAALSLTSAELPASLSTDEAAVRQKLVQGLADSRYEQAELSINEAEQLALAHHPKLLGEVILDRGTVFLKQNELSKARSALHRALNIARSESQPFLEASAETNLSFLATMEQHYGEAIDWGKAALALSQRLGARALAAKATGNLGWSYYKMGDLDTALERSTEAETLSAQLGIRKDELRWFTNIGVVHYDRRELEDAQRYYLQALSISKELDDRRYIGICLSNLALIAIERKQFDEATRYNREALEIKRSNKDRRSELYSIFSDARISEDRGDLPKAKVLLQEVIDGSKGDFSLQWEAQAELASLYAKLKQSLLAEQQFRKSLATIGRALAPLRLDEYKLTFLSSVNRFYEGYIAFLVDRKKNSEALRVTELNRARTLAEGLQLKEAAGRRVLGPFRPQEVSKRVNAVVLSYWLAPERSYLWAITPSRVNMFVLPGEREINEAVQNYRRTLAGSRDPRDIADANGVKLYTMLVQPAERLIPQGSRVVIIPDGSLYELNFETLLVPARQLHYWIDDAVITNASSLLLLRGSLSKTRTFDNKKLLLIGDSVSGVYPRLPQAASEIEHVKRYFPPNHVQTYSGKRATAQAYLEGDSGSFSYIHFVAHGVASRASPLDSAVILSGEESSYKLYARDIVGKRLHAKLVTISSCEGASGRTYAGEGLVGLSWAFLRAGAHQVVAALWEVDDTSTPQFMDHFYAEINAGHDPAVALRTAKLALLHSDSIYRRPFYWAPFQLYKGL